MAASAVKVSREMRAAVHWLPWLSALQLRSLLNFVAPTWKKCVTDGNANRAKAMACFDECDVILDALCSGGGGVVDTLDLNTAVKITNHVMHASYILNEGEAAWLVYHEAITASKTTIFGQPSKTELQSGYKVKIPTTPVPTFKCMGGQSLIDLVGPLPRLAQAGYQFGGAYFGTGTRVGSVEVGTVVKERTALLDTPKAHVHQRNVNHGAASHGPTGTTKSYPAPLLATPSHKSLWSQPSSGGLRVGLDDGFGGDLIRFISTKVGKMTKDDCLGCMFVGFKGSRPQHWLKTCPDFLNGNVATQAKQLGFQPR